MVDNTKRRRSSENLNNLDKGTLSVGPKGSDKVFASNDKPDAENVCNGTTILRLKGADRVVSDKYNIKSSKYIKTTLWSKSKSKGNLTGGKTLLSRAAKKGLPALGRDNNEKHCFGSEKNALLLLSPCKHKVSTPVTVSKET